MSTACVKNQSIANELKETLHALLSTDETLDDKADKLAELYLLPKARLGCGIFVRAVFVAIFSYFFTQNFVQLTRTQKFMSLQKSAGNCTSVGVSWSIRIDADYYGFWRGQLDFNPTKSLYQFSLNEFISDTSDGYTEWMKQNYAAILKVGNGAKLNNLAINLLYWSSWAFTTNSRSASGAMVAQTLTLSGAPRSILGGSVYGGTISNRYTDCDAAQSYEGYNYADATLAMGFSYSSMMKDATCNATVNPFALGYDPAVNGDKFKIEIDVRTLFAALSVNYQVNGPQSLSSFTTTRYLAENVNFGGVNFTLLEKYDPINAGMDPFACVGPAATIDDGTGWSCFLRVGNSYGAPFFLHTGINATYPQPCDCSKKSGMSPICDQFSFLAGLLVYDHTSNKQAVQAYPQAFQGIVPLMELLYAPPLISAYSASERTFPIAFAAALGQGSKTFQNKGWRNSLYSFSNTNSAGTASVITWKIISASGDQSITPDNYQLKDGACSDSMVSPYFPNLYNNPWALLTQPYYECTYLAWDGFNNAMGIARGIVGAFVPLGVQILLYLSLFIAFITGGGRAVQIYNKEKREKQKEGGGVGMTRLERFKHMVENGAAAFARNSVAPYSAVDARFTAVSVEDCSASATAKDVLLSRGIRSIGELFSAMKISTGGRRDLEDVAGFQPQRPILPLLRLFEEIFARTKKQDVNSQVQLALRVDIATACDMVDYLRPLFPNNLSSTGDNLSGANMNRGGSLLFGLVTPSVSTSADMDRHPSTLPPLEETPSVIIARGGDATQPVNVPSDSPFAPLGFLNGFTGSFTRNPPPASPAGDTWNNRTSFQYM